MADHRADLLRPRLIAPSEHRLTPWKNGLGTTSDVFLFPEGSSHETFDIRVSLAPIVSESVFSAFPGVDRWITRLGRSRLSLVFDDGDARALSRMEPLLFDSARTPRSRLPDGDTRVLNVMTRRGRWMASVLPLQGRTLPIELQGDALSILYLVAGQWSACSEGTVLRGEAGDTLVSPGPASIRITGNDRAEALLAILTRVGGSVSRSFSLAADDAADSCGIGFPEAEDP
ncbi:HutD/Ves family protein [Microvirga massiliensis]|uniref:HutD/Ves family protein n=1 Tax=Microvirga massiliensis TaxID=1033741 RepID=UPI000660B35B|nr:HutD family protein [Microvirga massiliensis]